MAYNGQDVQVYNSGSPVSDSNPFSVKIASGVLVNEDFDYISVGYPTTTQEVYTFKSGGSGGSTVATVTVNYTTSSKEFIDNVSRT